MGAQFNPKETALTFSLISDSSPPKGNTELQDDPRVVLLESLQHVTPGDFSVVNLPLLIDHQNGVQAFARVRLIDLPGADEFPPDSGILTPINQQELREQFVPLQRNELPIHEQAVEPLVLEDLSRVEGEHSVFPITKRLHLHGYLLSGCVAASESVYVWFKVLFKENSRLYGAAYCNRALLSTCKVFSVSLLKAKSDSSLYNKKPFLSTSKSHG